MRAQQPVNQFSLHLLIIFQNIFYKSPNILFGDLFFHILSTLYMRKYITFAITTIILLSCNEKKDNYSIVGHIDNCDNGDSITIAYSPNGVLLEEISKSAIKDGKFAFNGYVDNDKIAYICYKGDGRDICSMFFLEKGNTEILIDSTRCIAKGTPLNNLSNIIEDSVRYYISRLEIIEEQYYSDSLSEDEFTRLGAEGLNLQEHLVNYLRKTVQENIGNLLGLYMLVVYNDFFTSEELAELIAQIPPSSIDKTNNPLYDIIIGIAQERKAWE